ncbi:hypothetical protein [Umezawaea sp. Da 62-37]|uniref:hypothetical protein n=1 Tax=Umezawaea sp. Da 62-37 TaxID=3075927 RepID=UPI0028F7212C|nr:hypothetical protein [Umezawaea sp. Da 62-37]WNV86587.1 hypothetical protein RM788_52165 [Umezawaea sp. Da 62-37]
MNSDETQTSNPDEHAVFLTHGALEIARGEFGRAVTKLATRPSAQATALRTVLAEQAAEVRTLHALSVGYGWSEAIHRVTTPEVLDRAREHGHVGTDLATGCPVLTGTGQRALSRWRDFVSPLRDLPEYAPMWLFVHGLDG